MTDSSAVIDISQYSDGLEPHTISKINVNGIDHKITECAYIGDLSEYPSGYHFEIIDIANVRVFPVDIDDTIQLTIIFKTSETATEIPFILDDYLDELVSGVIAKLRMMPRYAAKDMVFHAGNYKSGISKAKSRWFKNNTGSRVKSKGFV